VLAPVSEWRVILSLGRLHCISNLGLRPPLMDPRNIPRSIYATLERVDSRIGLHFYNLHNSPLYHLHILKMSVFNKRSLQSRRQRQEEAPTPARERHVAALPPYEPPTCPLTERALRDLSNLSNERPRLNRQYDKHLQKSLQNLTSCTGDINDVLYGAKERVRRLAEKRERQDEDAEKGEDEEAAEIRALELERRVERLTRESERAVRELVDWRRELQKEGDVLKQVGDEAATNAMKAAAAATQASQRPAAPARRRRAVSDDEDLDDTNNGDASFIPDDTVMSGVSGAADANTLSPLEILLREKAAYIEKYASMSLAQKYASDNDYIGFRKIIHDAQFPGENAPPMPHASTWFEGLEPPTRGTQASRPRRQATQAGHEHEHDEEDEEEEIQIQGVVSSLKCPLTLKTFRQPYSNRVCKHTFEKSAILEFHHANAVAFADPVNGVRARGRQAMAGKKMLKCPAAGCEAMLSLEDFYDDQIIFRQVKRQEAQEREEEERDAMGGDDVVVPATQRDEGDGGFRSFVGSSPKVDRKSGRRKQLAPVKGEDSD
jgi:hypothetical protein